MSEICELRAVTYKDIMSTQSSNNLFNFWLLYKNQAMSDGQRTEFFRFIEEHCRELMDSRYRLRESPFFDASVFEETMKLVESYYKLDPQLAALTKKT